VLLGRLGLGTKTGLIFPRPSHREVLSARGIPRSGRLLKMTGVSGQPKPRAGEGLWDWSELTGPCGMIPLDLPPLDLLLLDIPPLPPLDLLLLNFPPLPPLDLLDPIISFRLSPGLNIFLDPIILEGLGTEQPESGRASIETGLVGALGNTDCTVPDPDAPALPCGDVVYFLFWATTCVLLLLLSLLCFDSAGMGLFKVTKVSG